MFKKIEFYENSLGVKPVEQFIKKQKEKVQLKILYVLKIIEEINPVPSKFLKKLTNTDEIWEVKIEYESNIFRIFGFVFKENFIILTNVYQKKTQKTNSNQIRLAEKLKKDFLERNKNS